MFFLPPTPNFLLLLYPSISGYFRLFGILFRLGSKKISFSSRYFFFFFFTIFKLRALSEMWSARAAYLSHHAVIIIVIEDRVVWINHPHPLQLSTGEFKRLHQRSLFGQLSTLVLSPARHLQGIAKRLICVTMLWSLSLWLTTSLSLYMEEGPPPPGP